MNGEQVAEGDENLAPRDKANSKLNVGIFAGGLNYSG